MVLAASLWVNNASANVVMVQSSPDSTYGYQGYRATCPSGYVITGILNDYAPGSSLPFINATTVVSAGGSNGGESGDNAGAKFILICAKVCN